MERYKGSSAYTVQLLVFVRQAFGFTCNFWAVPFSNAIGYEWTGLTYAIICTVFFIPVFVAMRHGQWIRSVFDYDSTWLSKTTSIKWFSGYTVIPLRGQERNVKPSISSTFYVTFSSSTWKPLQLSNLWPTLQPVNPRLSKFPTSATRQRSQENG